MHSLLATLLRCMFLEIELKLHIAPEDANLLHDHPIILEHADAEPMLEYLVSVYYDTPDLALRRHGYALRTRQSGERFYITVKSNGEMIGDLHHRHEWEYEIEQLIPNLAVLEPDIRQQITDIVGDQPLQEIFRTEFQRTHWLLKFTGVTEPTHVEIALDFGEVRSGSFKEQLSEIELELKAGDSAKLYEIANVLSKSIPLSVETRSKAERGYQLCSKISNKSATN